MATCKLNDVNPIAYRADTFDAIINGREVPAPNIRTLKSMATDRR